MANAERSGWYASSFSSAVHFVDPTFILVAYGATSVQQLRLHIDPELRESAVVGACTYSMSWPLLSLIARHGSGRTILRQNLQSHQSGMSS
jgi:hypothetical protein